MKATTYLFFLFFFCGISYSFAQDVVVPTSQQAQQVYIETAPNAILYEMNKTQVARLSGKDRVMFDSSTMKQKKVRKPTQFALINLTNLHKVAEYDAYMVELKDKPYLISVSDIVASSFY